MTRPGYQLAELNVGRLVAEPEDPRVAKFMNAIDKINGIGKQSPGFVWMMEGSGGPNTGNTENSLFGDPRMVTNLTVWENVETLEHFVWNTVHRQFYENRAAWFEVLGAMHFAMWWVPEGHRPTQAEAMERLEHLQTHGDSDRAFGWSYLTQARLWKTHQCGPMAAE